MSLLLLYLLIGSIVSHYKTFDDPIHLSQLSETMSFLSSTVGWPFVVYEYWRNR